MTNGEFPLKRPLAGIPKSEENLLHNFRSKLGSSRSPLWTCPQVNKSTSTYYKQNGVRSHPRVHRCAPEAKRSWPTSISIATSPICSCSFHWQWKVNPIFAEDNLFIVTLWSSIHARYVHWRSSAHDVSLLCVNTLASNSYIYGWQAHNQTMADLGYSMIFKITLLIILLFIKM